MSAPVAGERGLVARDLGATLGGRAVLRGASFAVAPGEFVALVGPNGAGKTSLLRAVAGLIRFEGAVRLDGRPIGDLSPGARARAVAVLPQSAAAAWAIPVRAVVALGRLPHGARDPARLAPADAAAVERAMAAAGVTALADRAVTTLSGGERARVMLARALATEAPVLLADEPTASLDPRHQLEVMALLAAAARAGAAVLAATHDLGLAARHAGRVMVLDAGALVADGPPGEALADAVLARVFGIEALRAGRDGREALVPWSVIGA